MQQPADYIPPRDAGRHEWILWASGYNGYAMLAQDPVHLADVLRPAVEEYGRTGVVPAWAGEHLLRGWLFFMVRADRHGGGRLLEADDPGTEAWHAVADRLRALRGGKADPGARR